MISFQWKYAIDMRLCGQERTKTRLNSHKLTLNSVTYCYHRLSVNSGLRHQLFYITCCFYSRFFLWFLAQKGPFPSVTHFTYTLLQMELSKWNHITDLLFSQLKRIQHRYTHSFTQWFGKYKRRCGITEDYKTFHSFRHALTTHLLEKDVEDYRIAWLVRHAIENQTTGRYCKRFYPDIFKAKVIDMIDYHSDLSHLKNSKFVPK